MNGLLSADFPADGPHVFWDVDCCNENEDGEFPTKEEEAQFLADFQGMTCYVDKPDGVIPNNYAMDVTSGGPDFNEGSLNLEAESIDVMFFRYEEDFLRWNEMFGGRYHRAIGVSDEEYWNKDTCAS